MDQIIDVSGSKKKWNLTQNEKISIMTKDRERRIEDEI